MIREPAPDPSGVQSPFELIWLMRQAMDHAGLRPRQVAARTGGALTRREIATMLRRDELPTAGVVAAFVRACGYAEVEVDAWVRRQQRLAADLEAGLVPPAPRSHRLRILVGGTAALLTLVGTVLVTRVVQGPPAKAIEPDPSRTVEVEPSTLASHAPASPAPASGSASVAASASPSGRPSAGANPSSTRGTRSPRPTPSPPAPPPSVGLPTPVPSGPTPAAPLFVFAFSEDRAVELFWSSVSAAKWYAIYQRNLTTGSDWVRLPGSVTGTGTTVTGLTNGQTYEFKLRSGNDAGEGDFSSPARATPN